MFNKLLITTSLLLSIALASCEDKDTDNQDDPVDTPTTEADYLHGQVTINGSPVENGTYTVSDYFSNATPDNGSFDMETVVFEGLPQIMMVTNNEGDIVMLNKSFDTNKTINEESTALALATLNPLFSKLKEDEYDQVMDVIKATPSYQSYYDEVCKSIANGKDIFDTASTSLADKLGNVLNELFSTNVSTQTPSRAIDGVIDDDKTSPIRVRNEGATVLLDIAGLNPSYEVSVIHNAQQYGDDQLIKTHDSYGPTDVLFSFSDIKYGEPTNIYLKEDGRYDFICSFTTDKACWDLRSRLLSDFLNAFNLVPDQKEYEIIAPVINQFVNELVNIDEYLYDNYDSKTEIITSLTSVFSELAFEKGIELLNDKVKVFGISVNLEGFKKLVKGASNVLNKAGIVNGLFRTAYALYARRDIEFSLCVQSGTIQKCENPDIYILEGNNQTAKAGETLPIDLKVGVNATFGSRVRFEVTSGGGKIDKEYSNIHQAEDGNKYATAKWTLGSSDKQTVEAYITNQDGTKASLSVKFTAYIKDDEGDYLMSVGDFVTFEYDSEGKPKEVSMTFDDYSTTSSFSYDPMVITNILEDEEIYKSTWQDFKFSDDGKRITSFKWVEDGDGGTVTIKYDPDDRIISIKDNTPDGSTVTTFDWDVYGRLLKTHTVEIDDEWPEDLTLTYTYGDEEVECTSHMYPFIMCMEEPWFFMTGLFGDGPAYLPTGYNYQDKYEPDGDFHLNLKYVTRDDGKILSEECSGAGANINLGYRYGSIEANSRSVSSGYDFASFPGFNKEKRKIRRIGHSRR